MYVAISFARTWVESFARRCEIRYQMWLTEGFNLEVSDTSATQQTKVVTVHQENQVAKMFVAKLIAQM